MEIERTIIGGLLDKEGFAAKVIPFLDTSYFESPENERIVQHFKQFFHKYAKVPTRQALAITLNDDPAISETVYQAATDALASSTAECDQDWLLDRTEEFCKEQALYNAIKASIEVMQGENKKLDKGALPKLLQDALAVSFDPHIGHDYFDDAMKRFMLYRAPQFKVPTGIAILDEITLGGFSRKTLNLLIAGTHVGKTLVKVALAAKMLMQGRNVLYITNEMAEEEIARRIDAQLLRIPIPKIGAVAENVWASKLKGLKDTTTGRLIIKEYPTGTGTVAHHRALLQELKIKRGFVPDVIFVDYLNITASQFYKKGNVSSYEYMKAVAEELRALAQEFNVVLISSTQTNRTGYGDSDIEMDGTAESFGVPMTADFMLALVRSPELQQLNQMLCKQLKNRYRDKGYYEKFCLGVNTEFMDIFDLDNPDEGLMQASGEIKKASTAEKFSKFK